MLFLTEEESSLVKTKWNTIINKAYDDLCAKETEAQGGWLKVPLMLGKREMQELYDLING